MSDKWSIGFAVCAVPIWVAVLLVSEGRMERQRAREREQMPLERARKAVDLLKDRIELGNQLNDLAIEVSGFSAECANLDVVDWRLRKCGARRRALLTRAAELSKQNEELEKRRVVLDAEYAKK